MLMFFLVRHYDTKEALGILSIQEICDPFFKPFYSPTQIAEYIKAVVYENVTQTTIWYIDDISQAEYETYRDLHELKVFT